MYVKFQKSLVILQPSISFHTVHEKLEALSMQAGTGGVVYSSLSGQCNTGQQNGKLPVALPAKMNTR